MKITTI